jgi:redox-sensitive bicupin YhaK (pirin superfamily)
VSPDGSDNSLVVNQELHLYASILDQGAELKHSFVEGHNGWIQVVEGEVEVDGEQLIAGDGAAIEQAETLVIKATTDAEFLLFDLG